MRFTHALKGRLAIILVAMGLFLGLGGIAYASSVDFGYTLPGYQENVTLKSGTRASSSSGAGVNVTRNDNNKKFWLWCDAPSVNTRVTNSVLVTGKNYYTLSYWTRGSGNVHLRGCTDGWQEPNYVAGNVSF
ncbi:hypothetical protein [Collinsella sp. An2]|uniref:hypothetical protein n=1 Tax=Collinsella sp. An2 TaxID=1965585 RepID=UPI00117D091F|nr:hypothetical protein [Collinsella sp. An2]